MRKALYTTNQQAALGYYGWFWDTDCVLKLHFVKSILMLLFMSSIVKHLKYLGSPPPPLPLPCGIDLNVKICCTFEFKSRYLRISFYIWHTKEPNRRASRFICHYRGKKNSYFDAMNKTFDLFRCICIRVVNSGLLL